MACPGVLSVPDPSLPRQAVRAGALLQSSVARTATRLVREVDHTCAFVLVCVCVFCYMCLRCLFPYLKEPCGLLASKGVVYFVAETW